MSSWKLYRDWYLSSLQLLKHSCYSEIAGQSTSYFTNCLYYHYIFISKYFVVIGKQILYHSFQVNSEQLTVSASLKLKGPMFNRNNGARKEQSHNCDLEVLFTSAGVGQFVVYVLHGLQMEARVYFPID